MEGEVRHRIYGPPWKLYMYNSYGSDGSDYWATEKTQVLVYDDGHGHVCRKSWFESKGTSRGWFDFVRFLFG